MAAAVFGETKGCTPYLYTYVIYRYVRNIAKLPQNNPTLTYRTVSPTVHVMCELGMCRVTAAGVSGFVHKSSAQSCILVRSHVGNK